MIPVAPRCSCTLEHGIKVQSCVLRSVLCSGTVGGLWGDTCCLFTQSRGERMTDSSQHRRSLKCHAFHRVGLRVACSWGHAALAASIPRIEWSISARNQAYRAPRPTSRVGGHLRAALRRPDVARLLCGGDYGGHATAALLADCGHGFVYHCAAMRRVLELRRARQPKVPSGGLTHL